MVPNCQLKSYIDRSQMRMSLLMLQVSAVFVVLRGQAAQNASVPTMSGGPTPQAQNDKSTL